MKAQQFIVNRMHGYSMEQMTHVLARVSPNELDTLQYLIDMDFWETTKAANVIARKLVRKYAMGMVPSDVDHRDHMVISVPVVKIANVMYRRVGIHPVVSKYGAAMGVLFTGAYMAVNPIEAIPKFIWDGVAYTIHGLGVAPIIEAIIKSLKEREK